MNESAPDPAVHDATDIHGVVAALRASFDAGSTLPIDARLDALAALRRAVVAERSALERALAEDLAKSPEEAMTTEIGIVLSEIDHMRRHLRSWLRPGRFSVGAALAPGTGRIVREPLGTVLVIAPWNYPLQLALAPVVGALAGGNTVVLKPSEVAPATSAALARLVDRHLDPAWIRVVEGGVEETTALLAERFDLIFYTGNGAVGRIVARAAAEHLTPTVLELGGKSPVFVDEGVDLARVARRIVWGKFTNAGQTCVCPDYLMGTEATLRALVPHLRDAITEMYGPDPRTSRAYGRIVNAKHLERLTGLLEDTEDADAVIGGKDGIVADERYIPPTVLQGVSWDDPVMGEEIFGPILPMLAVDGPAEAVARIRAGEKPLTAYVFTDDDAVRRLFTARTSSGSLAFDLTLAHLGAAGMPFGGVGESGMGAYHGRASLEAFTHAKPVVSKPLVPDTLAVVYPPHTRWKSAIVERLLGG
ncbi:aldehyde dehydrogenase family protein [Brachybacterium huguangmaarense]